MASKIINSQPDTKHNAPRITESANEMSMNIDTSSPVQILRILRTCDAQIFSGWHAFENIYDFIPIISIIIRHCKGILSDTINNRVILSGSGTSGRLAWVISRAFNQYLTQQNYSLCFDYCISGYDKALLTSQALPEDDPTNGLQDLLDRTKNAKKVLLIGITCGLSAPYVGGQIEYAMKQDNYITVLMGFNPAHGSRNRPVEKWIGKTFRQMCLKFNANSPKPSDFIDINDENNTHYQQLPSQILLNPILGPEPITGSTRMKGASATKILLDVIFVIAFYQIHKKNDEALSIKELNELIYDMLREYENIYRESYSYKHLHELSKVCRLTGDSLQTNDGKVIYYGGDQDTSIMSFIDASEMRPTYGTVLKRYRSYVKGGWKFLNNKQGDLSQIDERFQIEPKYLDIASLSTDDLVVFVGNVQPPALSKVVCKFACLSVGIHDDESKEDTIDTSDVTDINYEANVCLKMTLVTRIRKMLQTNCGGLLSTFDNFCTMFAMKLLLNGVSTAGHVLSGTVLYNRMINVRVSNDKLFYRSIGMVQEFGGVEIDIARQCLLMSIYGEDQYKHKENDIVEKHLIAASDVDKIVPVAIVLASQISQQIENKKSVKEILDLLSKEPSVRKVLKQQLTVSHINCCC
eukprot:190373_1